MKQESILYGIIGLLAGMVLAGFAAVYAVNNDQHDMMRMMGMRTSTTSQGMMNDADMSMGEMTGALKSKTGDSFDKAFITGMVAHHQGAIDMANLAKQNAKHDEIKKLADDIVAAQTKEINEMRTWHNQWGYGELSTGASSHSMYDMMGR